MNRPNFEAMKKLLFLFAFALAFKLPCFAWGAIGHRVVGEIADKYLTKKAKLEIQKILGNESLAISTTWADFIKSDNSYRPYSVWHYVNLPAGESKAAIDNFLKTDTALNAYNRIMFLMSELKTNRLMPMTQRQEYLKFLVHIVGDIHQPLHLGRVKDRGGNSIRVTWFRDSVNLHQIWDEKLIENQQLSYTEYATMLNYSTPDERKMIQQQSLSDNIWQTYQLTERIYAETKNGQALSWDYDFKFIKPLNEQLRRSGIYLAGILNSIYN